MKTEFWGVGDLLQNTQLPSGREPTAARSAESKRTFGGTVFFSSVLLPLWQSWSLLPLLQAEAAAPNQLPVSKICYKYAPVVKKGGPPGRIEPGTLHSPLSLSLTHSCCAHNASLLSPHPHPQLPDPQPLLSHRPGRFLVTVPPSVVKIAEQLERIPE